MAIPASGAISMSMLATEFSSSQTANMSLFGLASKLSTPVTSNIFEAASFYGQSLPVSLTSFTYFTGEEGPFEDGSAACEAEEPVSQTGYHDGSTSQPVNGDKVYTDSGGTTALSNGFYKMSDRGISKSFEIISGNGTVANITNC